MNERSTFESRLDAMFAAYADRAPIEVDASTLATHIAAARPRRAYDRPIARNRWLVAALIGLLLIAAFAATVYVAAQLLTPRVLSYDERFAAAADMSAERVNGVAVVLADGRILVSQGADGSQGVSPAELYDPGTGASIPVTGDSPHGSFGTGIGLKDGGALVVSFSTNTTSSKAYLYDPFTNSYKYLEQPGYTNSPIFGVHPEMALLRDGRVLMAGGTADVYEGGVRAEAMLFDPATEQFVSTGSMTERRAGHCMATLNDGRVLIVGGLKSSVSRTIGEIGPAARHNSLSSAEIYDPATGFFSPAGSLSSFAGKCISLTLSDGRVAVMPVLQPAEFGNPEPDLPTQVEVFDPATGEFTLVGSTQSHPDVAFPLRDGRILMVGSDLVPMNVVGPGEYWDRYQPWALAFDPNTGESEALPPPRSERSAATVLPDGRVLFAGGMAYPAPDDNGNGTGEAFPVPWVDIFE